MVTRITAPGPFVLGVAPAVYVLQCRGSAATSVTLNQNPVKLPPIVMKTVQIRFRALAFRTSMHAAQEPLGGYQIHGDGTDTFGMEPCSEAVPVCHRMLNGTASEH